MRSPYHHSQKYISTTFDILMIGLNLFLYQYEGGYSSPLKSPTFMNFILALMLAAFRFKRRLPIYGAVVAVAVYGSLFGYLIATGQVEFGTPFEIVTTPKINLVYEIYRVAYLVTTALLLIVLVENIRRLITLRVHEAENALREQAEREKTRAVFERYFTPQIANYLTDHPQDMGGRNQRVTVVLADLRGFTAISERLGPSASVKLLNTVFGELTRIVFEHNGTIDKFTGDGVLIVFGTPDPRPDDPLRAIRAATGILEAVGRLDLQPRLQLGIAIHTGDVIFGNIGSPQRMELTVIGDTVNTASRIEALNKEFNTSIIITEPTYREVEGYVQARKLPRQALRGKANEIGLYAVDGLRVSAPS
jgi:adenylate cyclase